MLKEATARSDSIRKETKSAAVKLYDSLVIAFGERDIPKEYTPSSLDLSDRIEPERLPSVHDHPEVSIENASEETDHLSTEGAEGVQANQPHSPPATPEVSRGAAPGSGDQKSKSPLDSSAVDKKSIQPKSQPKVEVKTNTDSNRVNELTPDTNFGEAQESIASASRAENSAEPITNDESAPRELEENEVFFPSNSFLFTKGDKADFFYVIVSGKIQLIEPRGQTLIATLEPPTSFGEQAILAGGIRSLSAQAIEPTICKAYSVDTLGKLLDRAKGTNKPVIYALLLELYMRNDIKSHQTSVN